MREKSILGIVAVLILLLIGVLFVVPMMGMIMWGPIMGGGMMGGWGYPTGMRWGLMSIGMLIPLGFIVLLIVGAYFFLTPRGATAEIGNALKILDERYAKGELTRDQYLEMKQNITKK